MMRGIYNMREHHRVLALAVSVTLMTLTLTACSTQTQEASLGASSVELGDSTPKTVAETTVTTEYTIPNLNEDVFTEGALEVLHTDFKPSQELESEIMQLINDYGTTCSLYMVNLEDYATFGYNSDTYISTASTIKCPFAFYCYQEIAKGNYSFDDTLLYKSSYYSSGTGVLKDNGSGTYYTVRDLLYYMIHYSDNVAFLMLQDYFGYEGYNEMMSNYGFETYLSDTVKWGKLSSHALGYIWTEIYKFKDECEEGAIFYDTLVNAGSNFLIWPFTEAGYNYKIAHKSGWASPGYHDSGIVFSEHPFVIVVMTDSDGETRDSSFFYNIVLKLNELHDEYLEYLGQEPSQTGVELPVDGGYGRDTTTAETTTESTTTTSETTTEATTTTTIQTTVETTTTTIDTLTPTTFTETTTTPTIDANTDADTPPIDTTTQVEDGYIPEGNEQEQYYRTETYVYQDPNQNTQQYQQYEDGNLYF